MMLDFSVAVQRLIFAVLVPELVFTMLLDRGIASRSASAYNPKSVNLPPLCGRLNR